MASEDVEKRAAGGAEMAETGLAGEHSSNSLLIDPEMEKKVVRKIDWSVHPHPSA